MMHKLAIALLFASTLAAQTCPDDPPVLTLTQFVTEPLRPHLASLQSAVAALGNFKIALPRDEYPDVSNLPTEAGSLRALLNNATRAAVQAEAIAAGLAADNAAAATAATALEVLSEDMAQLGRFKGEWPTAADVLTEGKPIIIEVSGKKVTITKTIPSFFSWLSRLETFTGCIENSSAQFIRGCKTVEKRYNLCHTKGFLSSEMATAIAPANQALAAATKATREAIGTFEALWKPRRDNLTVLLQQEQKRLRAEESKLSQERARFDDEGQRLSAADNDLNAQQRQIDAARKALGARRAAVKKGFQEMYELDEQLLQETDAMQREQEQLAAAPTCPDDPCLQRQLDTHRRLNVQLQQLRGKWKDLIERRRQLTAESQAIADEVEANEAHQRDVTTQRIELDENIRAYNTKVAPLDAALVAVRSLLAQNSADQMALGPHPPLG